MDRLPELAAFYSVAFQSPLIAFVLTSLIIEMTPGPNMAYLAVLSTSRGRIAGFAAVLGVVLGLALLSIAVGLGAGSLILNNRFAYESLRWAGALYLCWLAYDSWNEGRQPIKTASVSQSLLVQFRRVFITNLLNPKAACSISPSFRNSSPAPRLRHANWQCWFLSTSLSPPSCMDLSYCWRVRYRHFLRRLSGAKWPVIFSRSFSFSWPCGCS